MEIPVLRMNMDLLVAMEEVGMIVLFQRTVALLPILPASFPKPHMEYCLQMQCHLEDLTSLSLPRDLQHLQARVEEHGFFLS
jgi:hypothetical protein